MSAFPDSRDLRRRLTRLVALELVQRMVGTGVLVGIAVRAAWTSGDRRTALWVSALVVAALAHLALAFRTRAGAEHVRRDMHWSEARDVLLSRPDPEASHPYRLPARK